MHRRGSREESGLKWGLVVHALGAGLLLVAISIALLNYDLTEQDDESPDDGPFSPSDAPAPNPVGETEL